MADEYNPVNKATLGGGYSILGSTYDWGGPPTVTETPEGTTTNYGGDDWMSGISTIDPSTLTQAPGLPDFGSMSDTQLSSYLGSPDFGSLLSSLSGLTGGGGKAAAGASTAASGGGWLQNLISSLTGGAGGTGLGPYAATAGIGIYEAKQAQKDAQAKANELKGLGTPFLDQSKALLDQYKAGTLRPEQQQLVDFTSQQGQNLIQSGTALSAIAQQAFQDYQAGKLPAADEKRLQDQITAQKQAVRQRLSSANITDSTILTAQDQLIDDQATQQRQALLDARFATGNQAYDQWLKSTEAGQQLVVQGQQFASQAFETMLNDALGFGQAGMEPVASSIALAMQSDKELSDSITQLLGNLASAYAYTVAGPGNAAPAGTGGAGGASSAGGTKAGGSTLQSIVGGIGSIANLWSSIGKLFGGGPSAAGGEAAGAYKPPTTDPGMSMPSGADSASSISTLGNLAGGALGAFNLYSGIKEGGPGGTSQALLGASKVASSASQILGSANSAGAAGTAAGGGAAGAAAGGASAASALSSVATGAGLAGAFIAVAAGLVHAFAGGASKTRNVETFKKSLGENLKTAAVGKMGGRGGGPQALLYNIPGKGWVTGKDLNEIAGAWYGATFAPDGDQAGWAKKLEDIWANTTPITSADQVADRLGINPKGVNQDAVAQIFAGG